MLGTAKKISPVDRRHFIGGFDARIIMGQDEKALIRLWQEKRGEVGPVDVSGNLQLGFATEDLNRTWYERNTGRAISAAAEWINRKRLLGLISDLAGDVAGSIANEADDLTAGRV